MKTFIILSSFFCVAMCYPWGLPQQIQDTPEVAAAKSKHLAAHAKARYSTSSWEAQDRSWDNSDHDDGSWKDDTNEGSWNDNSSWEHKDDDSAKHHDDGSWKHHDSGSWKDDTNSWNHHSAVSHYDNHEKKWTGPVALPPGYDKHGAPLQVLDTPEVAAEKSKHFHLYVHAASHAAPHSEGWAPSGQHGDYHGADHQY